ncbi:MAG: tripartite tricarboxylate transporter substrate binding protein [Burkholderiaceae bacterium]|nr:tripartite tricarboxylate transporter substrate binding protein [Burkholderiaceae bacterium]
MTKILRPLATALACLLCAAAMPAGANDAYPEKPVHLIVPFPPGGGTDAFARILARELSSMWAQPLVVDNRAGAQGNIGTQVGANAAPDGYTLTFAHQGVFTINPFLYDKIGFDPLADLVAVSRGTQQPFVLVAHPDVPATTLAELTALAKARPGKLTYASSSSGPQMAVEMYKMAAGVNLLHVPYKGAGPAVVDLLAGHVDLMVANPTSVAPHVRSGKLRALVVFGQERVSVLPDAPTAPEAGYPQLGENPEWYGITVPAGTPAAVIDRLNRDIAAALSRPQAQKAIRDLGMTPSTSSPEEFARQIRRDHETWGRVVKASGVRAN